MKYKFLLFMCAALSVNLSSRAQAVTTVAPTILGTYTLGIAVGTNDTLYVENQSDFRIYKIDPSGTASIFVGDGSYGTTDGTGTSASIQYVYDLEYSHTSGNLYFTQHGGGQVRKVTPAGVVSTLATVSGDGIGVAIGENDTLYTYSYSTGAFNKVDPAGTVTSLGTLPVYGMDLKFLNRDTLYLAGLIANNIYQVSGVTGIYSTLAGSGSAGYLDATGTSAQFYYPSGIVLDGDGYIYVSDNGNNRIRRITKSGVVSTYAGSGTPSTVDGTGTSASFEYPWGINIGYSTGNLYVTENVSGNIRKIVGPKALPLQWLSINASLNQHNKAMLQWQVNEKEVQSYQILKSTNAKDFEPIATITSKGNGVNKYSYVDPQSLYNTTYYRICQTDKSGTQSQSSTMILSPTSQNNDVLKVYPTIVSENIHIESSTDQNIRIVNIMGKEVLQQSIKSEHTIISLQHLAIGIYYLYSSNGSIQMIEKK